jgi:hypothetical protein
VEHAKLNIVNKMKPSERTWFIVCLGLLIACSNPTKKNSVDESNPKFLNSFCNEDSEINIQTQSFDYLQIVGDSVLIPSFEIELKLSTKAEEKLKAENETVIVQAYFDGIIDCKNIPDKYKDRIAFGILHLISHSVELTDERLARFNNIKFSKELYDLLENKDIMLLINVFSGRKSSDSNLIDCGIIEGFMSELKEKKYTIYGKLIFNDDD